MIKYIKGNLFNTKCNIIAHGCNCVGGFGKGIAGQIRNRYPEACEEYLEKHRNEGWNLGDIQPVNIENKIIINCGTQFYYAGSHKNYVYADYDAIKECMEKIKQFCLENKYYQIAIPQIGCGLANGDWIKVERIINDVFEEIEVLVYVL